MLHSNCDNTRIVIMTVFVRIIFPSPPYNKESYRIVCMKITPRQDKQEPDNKEILLRYTGKIQRLLYNF